MPKDGLPPLTGKMYSSCTVPIVHNISIPQRNEAISKRHHLRTFCVSRVPWPHPPHHHHVETIMGRSFVSGKRQRTKQKRVIKLGPVTMSLGTFLLLLCCVFSILRGGWLWIDARLHPTPTSTPVKLFEPTPTYTPTMTLTPSITPTPTTTYTPSITPTPSNTPTPTSSPTNTAIPPTWTPAPPTEPPTPSELPPTTAPPTNPWLGCPERTCDQLRSCSGVRGYLSFCPQYWGALDRDGDNVPCESLCPGG